METKYEVYEDDNFHWEDEDERDFIGNYNTAEEAIAVCVQIVDSSLRHLYKKGFTPERFYDDYMDFGRDPFIRSKDNGCHFSARIYARFRVNSICEEMAATEL